MTRAPDNLLAVRRLLLAELGTHGLSSAEVGIVGDALHRGGYHCGSDRVVTNDYSVVESPRDRNGLTLDAAGLDVGTFRYGPHSLHTFSVWCVQQCVADAPDTRDIREIIYSPDGKVVRRWDRLRRRTTGDSSHLWHTHFSFFRDAVKAGRDQTPLFRRYLVTIGLIRMEQPTMSLTTTQAQQLADVWKWLKTLDGRNAGGQAYSRMALGEDHTYTDPSKPYVPAHPSLIDLGRMLTSLREEVATGNSALASQLADVRALLADAVSGNRDAREIVDEMARRLGVTGQ